MAVVLSGVPRVMGEGLAGLERLLPSERGVSLFGETHVRVVPGAAVAATKHVGQLVQRSQEQRHNWFEKNIYLSPQKARKEARRSQVAGAAAGVAASVVVSAAISGARWHMDRRHAEDVASSVLSIVAFAALDEDGTLGDPNAALLARVLDAFRLSERVRARVSARPVPAELSALPDTRLQAQARGALARYVLPGAPRAGCW